MEQLKDLLAAAATAMPGPTTPMPLTSTAKLNPRFETCGDPHLEGMLAAVQRLADEMKSGHPARWLSLLGGSGIGKTHLARALFRWVDSYGCFYTDPQTGAQLCRSVAFASWRRVATDLRQGGWGVMRDLASRWFLVIDDLGAEHQGGTGAVQSALEKLIDDRIGKWTVITSNLSHRGIAEQLDTRIASRMIRGGSVVLSLKGVEDFNLRRKA